MSARRNCDNCGSPIDWNRLKRERLGIRGPLNLDGTAHLCNRKPFNVNPPQQQQQQVQQPQQQPQQQQQPSYQDQKSATIQRLHDEKLAKEERLIAAIDNLTDAINNAGTNLASALSEAVGGDLAGLKVKQHMDTSNEDPTEGTVYKPEDY